MFGLFVGATGVGGTFTLNAPKAAFVAALVVSSIVFWFLFEILDGVGASLYGDAGPEWFEAETGIAPMAVLMIGLGLILLKRESRVLMPE